MSSNVSPAECTIVEAGAHLPPPWDFKRNIILRLSEVDSFRMKYANTGVYITPYRSNTPDLRNGVLYSDLYFDFDKENDFEAVRQDALMALSYLKTNFTIPYDVPRIYFSGSKGVHITIDADYLGILPATGLNEVFRLIANDISEALPNKTLDLKIYDSVRLFRLVNSKHQKTGLYKIPLTYGELKYLDLEDIIEIAKSPRPEWRTDILPKNIAAENMIKLYTMRAHMKPVRKKTVHINPLPVKEPPPCIEWIIKNGPREHSRNNTTITLASYYRQLGIGEEEAVDRILEWNDGLRDPLPEHEAQRCVRQAYERNYSYGCKTLQELSVCDPIKCCLKKKEGFYGKFIIKTCKYATATAAGTI